MTVYSRLQTLALDVIRIVEILGLPAQSVQRRDESLGRLRCSAIATLRSGNRPPIPDHCARIRPDPSRQPLGHAPILDAMDDAQGFPLGGDPMHEYAVVIARRQRLVHARDPVTRIIELPARIVGHREDGRAGRAAAARFGEIRIIYRYAPISAAVIPPYLSKSSLLFIVDRGLKAHRRSGSLLCATT